MSPCLPPSRSRLRRAVVAALALAGCRGDAYAPPLFELLPPGSTGVEFVNALPESADVNILNYLYYYNGGGVAAGDVDGDGLPDLYFTSNLGTNRLYRNLGDYRFEDVTERAGVPGVGGWTTGVTMADVNGDGHLDLYVSGVSYLTMQGRNVLYVNDGDGTFTDRTVEYGLDFAGYATQAAFFDYDLDGDLDVYLLNHSTHNERGIGRRGVGTERHPRAGDRLLRNDGARFTDVSDAAGIDGDADGYGLGVVASDLTNDGCPDLYVANDFQGDDRLYVNRCDGTFAESMRGAMGHTSRFSMGVDAADFDNDGRTDVFVADMLPEQEDVLKTSASSESWNLFQLRLRAGYHPQFARNTLQHNRGDGRFEEVGYLAGVHASDWSWSPLFADLDNDGRKDLFITNGIYRRPNDLDYISYVGNEAVQASLAEGVSRKDLALLRRMPQIPLPNYAFRNDGDLRFTPVAREWGLDQAGFSNGAVYVDLNNSGALDLVVNNVNAPAAIYRNRARELSGHGYLTVRLRGAGRNTHGVGARVLLAAGGVTQTLEQMPTRGFQSAVDQRLHFGLGEAARIDSLVVVWPDRRFQVVRDVAPNATLTLVQDSASGRYVFPVDSTAPRLADATEALGVAVRHEEDTFNDFDRDPLVPRMLSREGPALAVGDVNGDGLDDLYVGGAKWQAGTLLVQQRDGAFRAREVPDFAEDRVHEDVDAALFDADGDGDLDLYVVSGGNQFRGTADALRDRLYRNDGAGRFRRDRAALPDLFDDGSSVAPADFDGDGDVDLFVGTRVLAGQYGLTPASRLLRNDGRGRFTDATAAVAPALAEAGMVTGAAWSDVDGDGALDLAVVGDWMPVRIYRQEAGRLVERTRESGLAGSEGWWNAVAAADLDGDGRDELVLGNLGLNAYLKAAPDEPARLHVHDFGGNGTLEQILTFYKHGVSYPVAGRDDLVKLMPQLRSRYTSYTAFGASRLEDIFPAAELSQAVVREARTFASAVARNDGRGRFTLEALPTAAQVAPVRAVLAHDVDGDGLRDVLLGGNEYAVPPMLGQYDASRGLLLRGLPDGRLAAPAGRAGELGIDGEVRRLRVLRAADGATLVAVARNDAPLQILRVTRPR